MEPPVTPKPMPASSPDLPTDHTSKLFRIVYITLTGVINTIVPAASPWSWVGKSASYLLKLALLLWWARGPSACKFPRTPHRLDHWQPWLLAGLVLMGLNAYLPQLFPVSSLWSSLRVTVLVIHWTASWWFISPG
ncbi:hypothetical protein DSO57_1011564 [Entomophthora muscae]|uniref:Uncharacterized protein n=1 Tax=Entomophthora muscae TaxID=34485 RepID=A0ACC2SV29_9FUNG|nr:hypothetical protein DSO57_1011564 [Entomophthora muscae]